jgi:5-methylthioadenosine/S-adenosylhomocysteine deaminase
MAHRTLFRNATVLTMDDDQPDLPRGDVLIDGAVITEVGVDLRDRLAADGQVVDASGRIIVPGFVDTHRHMWEALMRGAIPQATLEDYFERVLFGVAPHLTADELGISEALGALASLDAGITTVQDTSDINDAPERTDALVAALRQAGVRAVFAYGLPRSFVRDHGASYPDDIYRVRRELLSDDSALVTMALGIPNGDDRSAMHNAALARELGLRTAHHVRTGITPSWLRQLDALLPQTTFVHGNGLAPGELRTMADVGGSLSIAPMVELAMQLGRPMITEALSTPGLNICLSVDVEVTSPTDMFTQMRLAYLTARSNGDGDGPSALDVLAWATINGARALGLDAITGSVTPGKQADLVLLRPRFPSTAPVLDPYSTVVMQMDRANVETVLVAGVLHKRDGRLVGDHSRLYADAGLAAQRVAGLALL